MIRVGVPVIVSVKTIIPIDIDVPDDDAEQIEQIDQFGKWVIANGLATPALLEAAKENLIESGTHAEVVTALISIALELKQKHSNIEIHYTPFDGVQEWQRIDG